VEEVRVLVEQAIDWMSAEVHRTTANVRNRIVRKYSNTYPVQLNGWFLSRVDEESTATTKSQKRKQQSESVGMIQVC
jgi:hypothetical protein